MLQKIRRKWHNKVIAIIIIIIALFILVCITSIIPSVMYNLMNIQLGDETNAFFDTEIFAEHITNDKELIKTKYLFCTEKFILSESTCSLDFLQNVPKTKYLEIYDCTITNYSGIAYLESLEQCNISTSHIPNKDIRYFYTLNHMKSLMIHNSDLYDISEITEISNLEGLNLSDNKITDISGIEKLRRLRVLSLHGNMIDDYFPLTKCASLERVIVDYNSIPTEIKKILQEKGVTIVEMKDGKIPDYSDEDFGLIYPSDYN